MSCIELVELVTAYFDGALLEDERARFEAHLGGCDGCQNYLDQMRRTITLVGTLREESIPSDVRERLLAAFHGWKAR